MISHLFVKFEQKYRLSNTSAANYANLYTNAAETKDDHLELSTYHQKRDQRLGYFRPFQRSKSCPLLVVAMFMQCFSFHINILIQLAL